MRGLRATYAEEMPELPEVEATCRGLAPEIAGKKITAVHVLRALVTGPQKPARLRRIATGRRIGAVERRGKNVLIRLSGGYAIRIHLRMTGRLRANQPVSAATRVWFELAGSRRLVFDDPRALGRVHIYSTEDAERVLAGLGPEPLGPEFTRERFHQEAKRSRQPAKLFLLDQKHVAGLGNIYAAEALFRARVNPTQPMNRLSRPKLEALHEAILAVLREAVESATVAYIQPGAFQEAERFSPAIYGREGQACRACGRGIRRIEQGGRSTYYCPNCQK